MLKTCTKCKIEKPLDCFTKDRARLDGLNPHCRDCTRANTRQYSAKKPEAARQRGRAWYANNKARRLAKAKDWIAANPGKSSEYCKRWREANPEAQAESERKWYERNRKIKLEKDRVKREKNLEAFLIKERLSYAKHRDKRLARNKNWRNVNKHKINFYASQRRSALAKRTPIWITDDDLKLMQQFFVLAKELEAETGVEHHVDHVIPLRGRYVSGLNVPINLQVIPALDNLRKSNGHKT